jgi:hypothetical protein
VADLTVLTYKCSYPTNIYFSVYGSSSVLSWKNMKKILGYKLSNLGFNTFQGMNKTNLSMENEMSILARQLRLKLVNSCQAFDNVPTILHKPWIHVLMRSGDDY